MMKQFRTILTALVLAGIGGQAQAATNSVIQALNFAVFGSMQDTATNIISYTTATNLLAFTNASYPHGFTNRQVKTYSTQTNTTVKTILINTPNVIKAIAIDLDKYRPVIGTSNYTAGDKYLLNGVLYHKIDSNLVESIVIRKPHAGTNIEVDVTSFFGGSAAIANNFNATSEIASTTESATGTKTNLVQSMNSVTFTSTNLAFTLLNAFSQSSVVTFGTNHLRNLSASGSGTFYVNTGIPYSSTNHVMTDMNFPTNIYTNFTTNIVITTTYNTITNHGPTNIVGVTYTTNFTDNVHALTGPAHGTFSTSVGTIVK